jgi:hypothetical protein
MAYNFQPIAMMGEQFNPMDSFRQTAELQGAYQQNQIRAMQLAEMARQIQESNANRQALASSAYGPQSSSTTMPAQTLGAMSENAPDGQPALTLPQRTYGANLQAGSDPSKYLSSLAQLAPQLVPGVQAQMEAARQKQMEEQQKAQDAHNQSQSVTGKNNADAAKAEVETQMKHIDMMGAAAGALMQLPPEQAAAAYPVTVAMLQSQGVDTSKFPPQFDPTIVGQAAQMAVSAKEQLQLKMQAETQAETVRHNKQTEANTVRGQNLVNARSSEDNSGDALTPQAIDQAAKLYLQTAQLPSMGMGKQGAKQRQLIMNRAAEIGQGVDLANSKLEFGAKRSTKTYFTSGAGGKQLTAFNTAITHLDTLDRLAGDLGNSDVQLVNRAKQAWAEQTGNPAPANFEAAKNAMSGEVAAALKASGATDQEIAHVGATFNRAQSPAQLKGAINTYRELLKSKAQQLKGQYDAGMKGGAAFDAPTGGGEVTATGPNGHKLVLRNGQWVDAGQAVR